MSLPPQRAMKQQSHHFIPRFILRRFGIEGEPLKTSKERKRAFRKTGNCQEDVLVYDLSSGCLERRPISDVFCLKDLYGDIKGLRNVYNLETKLSLLENYAARLTNELLSSLPSGNFKVRRKDLNQLRKFMFVMHYRQPGLSSTYFKEDHPENLPIGKWIVRYRERHALGSTAEMWLHVLRYHLDTPHHQILLDAQKSIEKYGDLYALELRISSSGVDPEDEHYRALAYESQANRYFLCIWEAADGEEFVLGENSFGLWEGSLLSSTGLHRVFVVSPKVVIVLRLNFARPDILPGFEPVIRSDLLDIKQEAPTIAYSNNQPQLSITDPRKLAEYRATKAAQRDELDFKITKLTSKQTYAVNRILLENVQDTGSITFSSKTAVLKTLRQYCSDFQQPNRTKFIPLLTRLENKPASTVDSQSAVAPDEFVDIPLFHLLVDILSGVTVYATWFDRATTILRHLKRDGSLPTSFSLDFGYTSASLVILFSANLGQTPRRSHAEVEELMGKIPTAMSRRYRENIICLGERCGLKTVTDPLDILVNEVAIVALLDWVARYEPDIYQSLLEGSHPFFCPPQPDEEIEIPLSLDDLMRAVIMGDALNFPSPYDRALFLFELSQKVDNPCSKDCSRMVAELVNRFSHLLKPLPSGTTIEPLKLVKSLTKEQSKILFILSDELTAYMGLQKSEKPWGAIINETATVGFLSWCAENRSDCLQSLFSNLGFQVLV